MFDWLDDFDVSDFLEPVGEAISSGVDYLGDAVSSGADYLSDAIPLDELLGSVEDLASDGVDYLGDLLNLNSLDLPSGDWELSFPGVEDISSGSFLNASAESVPTQVFSSPDTLGDFITSLESRTESTPVDYSVLSESVSPIDVPSLTFSSPEFTPEAIPEISNTEWDSSLLSEPTVTPNFSLGLSQNPVANEVAWKKIFEDPSGLINPKDYTLSSPTLLDKIISNDPNSMSIQGSTEVPAWFSEGDSIPSSWTLPEDNAFYGRSTVTDPEAYKPESSSNWLKQLLERPVVNQATGALGKSLLSKILSNVATGSKMYGALSDKSKNSTQMSQLKANLSQIPTKKMNWVVPKPMARGGSTGGGALCGCSRQGLLRQPTPGQADVIPIVAAGGEYIFDADTVSALGDGNTEAGAQKLDMMRQNIRRHKRSAPISKIPPKAKRPEQYLKEAK